MTVRASFIRSFSFNGIRMNCFTSGPGMGPDPQERH